MTTVPTSQTFVDARSTERPTVVAGPHPEIARFDRQRTNRAGHICRECRDPQCVGQQRDEHEKTFATAESSALLTQAQYFACPGCGKDVREAPACRTTAVA